MIFFPSDSSIIKGGIKSGIILQVKMPHNTVDKERDGLDFYFFFFKAVVKNKYVVIVGLHFFKIF